MGRTEKNIKFRIPEKPRKIKGFRLGGYRIATTISSQPRYDHFDTAAFMVTLRKAPLLFLFSNGDPVMSCCGARKKLRTYCAPFFRPQPLLFARFLCHRQRSQTSPLRYRCIYFQACVSYHIFFCCATIFTVIFSLLRASSGKKGDAQL